MIKIYKGDDTGGTLGKRVEVEISTRYDLTGCTVVFNYQGAERRWTGVSDGDRIEVYFSHKETSRMSVGTFKAVIFAVDASGKVRTITNSLPIRVSTNLAECYGDNLATVIIGESVPWGRIINTPTTLAGYGITDKVVKTVNGNAPDENGNIEVEEGGDEGLAPEFVANQFYFYGELVKHEGILYECNALNGYSGEWNGEYFSTTTASAALQDIRQMAAQKRFVARFYEGSGGELFKVNDIRWRDFGQYGTLQRCTNGGDAETAEWEDTTIGDVLALIAETSGSWTRKYVVVSGAESDEEMPTLMDFDEGRIVYDGGDDEQMPTAQELLGGDMVAELYMAGENRQGIEIYHDGIIIVKPYGGEMQVYEWSVVISEIMPVQTVLAKIYAAVQGDSEKPILIVELS